MSLQYTQSAYSDQVVTRDIQEVRTRFQRRASRCSGMERADARNFQMCLATAEAQVGRKIERTEER